MVFLSLLTAGKTLIVIAHCLSTITGADKRISIGDRLRYIPMGCFNKNNIGAITGIVTTTLGDVEGAAPVALFNLIGGFFNSAVRILFLV